MDIQSYISTGIIEEYCLGLLPDDTAAEVEHLARQHPEIDEEINRTLNTLSRYSAKSPPAATRRAMIHIFEQLAGEQTIDLSKPPAINRHSSHLAWKKAIDGLEPQMTEDGVDYHFFDTDENNQLCIVWLNDILVEEAHETGEFEESFLILEGTCECDLGGKIVRLGAGDYLDIPPNVRHSIRNTSLAPQLYVKAIVQRRKIA